MPSAILHATNSDITSWLAMALEKEIPDLDLDGLERKLLEFAYKDLEAYLKTKEICIDSEDIVNLLNDPKFEEEVKEFLKVWTKQWLEKWRERVTLCQKIPNFSLQHLRAKKKAKKIFKKMDDGHELKQWIVRKLINQGEVCMPDLIAENLIIEQIAFRLKMGDNKDNKAALEPWQVYNDVLPQVKLLAERKTPIIHMKLTTEGGH